MPPHVIASGVRMSACHVRTPHVYRGVVPFSQMRASASIYAADASRGDRASGLRGEAS